MSILSTSEPVIRGGMYHRVGYTTSIMRMLGATLLLLLYVIPVEVFGMQVYLESDSEYSPLDTFYVPVRIDTQGECVNAVRVVVAYDPAQLSVRDVSVGNSFLTLWTEPPQIARTPEGKEQGLVSFSGGVPGGYCGRLEGDPGLSNRIAELVVTGVPKALAMGERATTTLILSPETSVYLHDGTGNKANTLLLGAEVSLVQREGVPRDMWYEDVRADTQMPEFFDITLVEGPSVGNPYHYIVFSTVDKQSGISHYEVLETDPDRFGLLRLFPREAYWIRTESPYVLRDQQLRSRILVKAVDKNGNERTATYEPPLSLLKEVTRLYVAVPVALLLLVIVVGVLFFVRRKRVRSRRARVQKNALKEQPEVYE
jgi:hypothetical protein